MCRQRNGDGDESGVKSWLFGTEDEAKAKLAEIEASADDPFIEQHGSRTVGYHTDATMWYVEGDDIDLDNDNTWTTQDDVQSFSNEKQIPW